MVEFEKKKLEEYEFVINEVDEIIEKIGQKSKTQFLINLVDKLSIIIGVIGMVVLLIVVVFM